MKMFPLMILLIAGLETAVNEASDLVEGKFDPKLVPQLHRTNKDSPHEIGLSYFPDPKQGLNFSVEWSLSQECCAWVQAQTSIVRINEVKTELKVVGLRPFTKYKFRLRNRHYNVFSKLITVMTTEEYGIAPSPPKIISVRQQDNLMGYIEYDPPILPNGEIFLYHIEYKIIGSNEGTHGKIIRDVDKGSATFGHLQCNVTYQIRLQAQTETSSLGDSDYAKFKTFCPSFMLEDLSGTPIAIYVLNNTVYLKDISDNNIHTEPRQITQTNKFVRSMDFHIEKRFLYMVTSEGKIITESITKSFQTEKTQTFRALDDILELSVDWIYDRIYILKKDSSYNRELWIIDVCDLKGYNCERINKYFHSQLKQIQVDPYSGYIYYIMNDKNEDLLMRMNITSKPHQHCQPIPEVMLKSDKLGKFAVSYEENAIFIPNIDKNRMFKVDLDYPFKVNVLYETALGKQVFNSVKSLIRYNKKNFWTSKQGFHIENITPADGYSASLVDPDITSSDMKLFDLSTQPYPAVLNTATQLQAAFTDTKGLITWKEPFPLNNACAAYIHKWKYKVNINNTQYNIQTSYSNISNTYINVENLKNASLYMVEVHPYARNQFAPISFPVTTNTLPFQLDMKLVWSRENRVYILNGTGSSEMNINLGNNKTDLTNIVYVEQDQQKILYYSVESKIYAYDVISNNKYNIFTADYKVTNLIHEPYADRLYYTTHVDNTIVRITPTGLLETKYQLPDSPDQLMLDSELATFCWHSQGVGIFCKGLDHSNNIRPLLVTSNWYNSMISHVTLDPSSHKILYFLYSPLQAFRYELYELDIRSSKKEMIEKLPFPHIRDNMYSIPGKLIFQQLSTSIIIYDIKAMTFFEKPIHEDIKYLSISTRFLADNKLNVIPSDIDPFSITIQEKSERNYLIKWDSSKQIDDIKYNLILNNQEYFTNKTYFQYNGEPFEQIPIKLMPVTRYAHGKQIERTLYTNEKEPSKPENPRIFWETFDDTKFKFTFRWNKPAQENGILLNYAIKCLNVGEGNTDCSSRDVKGSEAEESFILTKSDYKFTIKASTSAGYGPDSVPVYTSKNTVNPVPVVVIGLKNPNSINLFDVDLNKSTTSISVLSTPEHLAYDSMSNSVFYIDGSKTIYRLNLNTKYSEVLQRLEMQVFDIALDFVGRFLYMVSSNHISRLNIQNPYEQTKLIHTNKHHLQTVNVGHDGYIYFTSINSQLFRTKFSHGIKPEIIEMSSIPKESSCPDSFHRSTFSTLVYKDEPSISWFDRNSRNLYISTNNLSGCKTLAENITSGVYDVKADSRSIYFLNGKALKDRSLYQLSFVGILQKLNTENLENLSNIISLDVKCDECQRVPTQCKTLTFTEKEVEFKQIDSSFVTIALPAPMQPSACAFNQPSTNYTITLKLLNSIPSIEYVDYQYTDYQAQMEFTEHDLKGNSEYETCIKMSNIYNESDKICTTFKTLIGIPDSPILTNITVFSPHKALLYWKLSGIEYSGNVTTKVYIETSHKTNRMITQIDSFTDNSKLFGEIDKLNPSTEYKVYLVASNARNESSPKSNELTFKTYSTPYIIEEPEISATSLKIHVSTDKVQSYQELVLWSNDLQETKLFKESLNFLKGDNRSLIFNAFNLTQQTCYNVNISVRYETNPKNTYNISLTEHCMETEILKPMTPSVPRIETNENGLNYITWSQNKGNIWYLLQMQNIEIDQDWKMIKNSSDNTFVTSVLSPGNYTFRVRSENQNGVSEFTAASDVIDIDEIRSQALVYKSQHLTVMAVCLSFACLLVVMACSMLFSWKIKHIQKETKNHKGLEGFLNHENPIYGNPVSDEDLKEIPQIKRDQLSFLNFLGKGAFGEVYQGTMKNMHDLEQCIAIKMLRQDASDNDKEDFLKEAKIMWNFKHDHIVNLEAICLDVEANFLILELMEEGDLLRYLRNHRPKGEVNSLTLLDQVEMSLDVAKGLEYLEKNKYVHRDIAARNCLVSRENSVKRNVKLADFGLARDIYKADYYRATSKNPLPVKWMSPEGLRDRKFTTQSDVWSFGILIWEILTFGTDPYPTMNNVEVMDYVINGKKLFCPEGTPERLLKLLNGCWSFQPDGRPSFQACVQLLADLIQDHQNSTSNLATCMPFVNGYTSNSSERGDRTATTVRVSQTRPYLQLVHTGTDYSVPSEHSEINCSCSQDMGSINYGNLRVSHDTNCDFNDINLTSGDTSATASVQTIARLAETSSVCNATKLSTTIRANSATNPCYLKTDNTTEVLDCNHHDNSEKISSNKDLDSKSLTPSLDSLDYSAEEMIEDSDSAAEVVDGDEEQHSADNNHKEETRETRVNSQSSQDSMISGTTDSGQGSGTSCGSTSDDEVVIIEDDIEGIEMQEYMKQFYNSRLQPQYDFPKHSNSYH